MLGDPVDFQRQRGNPTQQQRQHHLARGRVPSLGLPPRYNLIPRTAPHDAETNEGNRHRSRGLVRPTSSRDHRVGFLAAEYYSTRRTRGRTHAPREKVFPTSGTARSEEHTSELQSRGHLVCRLLLEKEMI